MTQHFHTFDNAVVRARADYERLYREAQGLRADNEILRGLLSRSLEEESRLRKRVVKLLSAQQGQADSEVPPAAQNAKQVFFLLQEVLNLAGKLRTVRRRVWKWSIAIGLLLALTLAPLFEPFSDARFHFWWGASIVAAAALAIAVTKKSHRRRLKKLRHREEAAEKNLKR
jgi:hypothetical protein